jgi:hypothetical protein
MSYRNPRIIIDRSAQIWAEGLNRVGAIIGDAYKDYTKIKAQAMADAAKKKAAYQKLLNMTALQYEKNLDSQIAKRNLPKEVADLLKQNATNKLQEIIPQQAALAMGGISFEQGKQYRKNISDYTAWENNALNKFGNLEVNLEPASEITSTNLGNKYNFKGQGVEQYKNFLAAQVLDGKSLPGVEVTPSYEGDDLSLTMKMNRFSDFYKTGKEAGLFNDDDFKVDGNGMITFKWERNMNNWNGDLIEQTLPDFDGIKAMQTAGIMDTSGNILSNIFTETSYDSKIKGNQNILTTKQYYDPDLIADNTVFKNEIKGYIQDVLTGTVDQQIEYVNDKLEWGDTITKDNWAKSSMDSKVAFLEKQLMDREIKIVADGTYPRKGKNSEIELGTEVVDGETKYYIKETKISKAPSAGKKDTTVDLSKEIYDGITKDTINYLVGRSYGGNRIVNVTPIEGTGERKFLVDFEIGVGKLDDITIDIDNPVDIEKLIDGISGTYNANDRKKAREYIVQKEEDEYGQYVIQQ